jgi:hypothetical protein
VFTLDKVITAIIKQVGLGVAICPVSPTKQFIGSRSVSGPEIFRPEDTT